MTGPATSPDDRQPGRSEYVERKEVTVHRFPDADASPPHGIGGNGAGSTAGCWCELYSDHKPECVRLSLRADLEAARVEIERLTHQRTVQLEASDGYLAEIYEAKRELAQSRATEAELRARVERLEKELTEMREQYGVWGR
jgi:hypothetical protein